MRSSCLSFLGTPRVAVLLGGHGGRCCVPSVAPPVQVGEESAASVRDGGHDPEELDGRHAHGGRTWRTSEEPHRQSSLWHHKSPSPQTDYFQFSRSHSQVLTHFLRTDNMNCVIGAPLVVNHPGVDFSQWQGWYLLCASGRLPFLPSCSLLYFS